MIGRNTKAAVRLLKAERRCMQWRRDSEAQEGRDTRKRAGRRACSIARPQATAADEGMGGFGEANSTAGRFGL
jgi:hypothetical protein